MQIKVTQSSKSEAERLRSLRLAALKDAPYAYGAVYEEDIEKPITFWQEWLAGSNWFFTSAAEGDIGLIGVEKAGADRGSDCWIFGWWIAPTYRGKGVAALMLAAIDKFCIENNWLRQGLGVWPENQRAINAYLKLGFIDGGKPIPSRSKPNQLYLPMYRNLSI
ncbi:MAG: GNAT family N-acetyltransferase [Candidatus Nanopelagicus sp.]